MVRVAMVTVILSMFSTLSAIADPVEGDWKTQSGETAGISRCGSSYCITLKTGIYKGRRIGRFGGSNGSYSGKITDPEDDRTYDGSATVSGSTMKMKGCVLMRIICKTQTWSKL